MAGVGCARVRAGGGLGSTRAGSRAGGSSASASPRMPCAPQQLRSTTAAPTAAPPTWYLMSCGSAPASRRRCALAPSAATSPSYICSSLARRLTTPAFTFRLRLSASDMAAAAAAAAPVAGWAGERLTVRSGRCEQRWRRRRRRGDSTGPSDALRAADDRWEAAAAGQQTHQRAPLEPLVGLLERVGRNRAATDQEDEAHSVWN